jgi:AsmA protein
MDERGTGRGAAKRIAVVVGGLAALVALALVGLVLLLQSGAVTNRVKDLVVPRISSALGRDVAVRDAKLQVFPNPRVALAGTTIAGRAGEPAMVDLESLDVELALWPLVTSLGKDVRVQGFTLVRPQINLVRGRDGKWNYEGLGQAGEKPASTPPAAEGGPGPRVFVEKARIQDGALRIVDRSQGRDDAAVALTRIDLEAEGGLGDRVAAKLTAALADPEKNVELEVASPKIPENVGPTVLPELTGRLALKGLSLARLRGLLPANVTAMFTGGRVDAEAKISSEPRVAAYRIEGNGKLGELRLKGEPASGAFRLAGRVDPRAGAAKLEITDLAVKGPGVDLGGTATLETAPVRARFAIRGPLLDLGTVLGLVPQDPKAATAPPAEETPKGALLPPSLAKEVAAVQVAGTIAIDRLVNGKLTATDVKADAALKEGVLTLSGASAGLYGGRVDASGTTVAIADPNPKWNLKAKLQQVDLGMAMQALGGASPLVGKATGTLDLAGVGSDWDRLKDVLTGLGAFSLEEGALTTTGLGDQALGAVAQGLETLGRGGLSKKVSGLEGGKTTLRDLAASFTVKDGWMSLTKPVAFATSVGQARLGGRVGLSQQLALDGTLALTKEALARAGVPLGSGVELPLTLGGSLSGPTVKFDAAQALRGAASGVVAEKRKAVEENVKKEATKRVEGLFKRLGK